MSGLPGIIETNRLILRPFDEADIQAAFGWFGDPLVMRYVPGGADRSIEQTKTRVASYRVHQVDHGFSKWVIVDRASLQPMGDSGLLVLQDYGWTDLGFRLARSFWGHGFATEAASAWVRAAFDEFRLARLGAFTHPDNAASIRVLEKLGFRFERRGMIMDMDALVYTVDESRPRPPR